jgi:hypothetical protein
MSSPPISMPGNRQNTHRPSHSSDSTTFQSKSFTLSLPTALWTNHISAFLPNYLPHQNPKAHLVYIDSSSCHEFGHDGVNPGEILTL